jgi:hypothetical protein
MLTITNSTVTREQVWVAFRHTADVRLRERYHAIVLLMDGEAAPRWGSGSTARRRPSAPGCTRSMRLGCAGWSGPRSQGGRRDSPRRNGRRSKTRSVAVPGRRDTT